MNVYFVYKVLTNRIRALIIAAGYIHITNSHVVTIKYHMQDALSNIVRVLLDVISVYSLNPGKLPGRFSY